MTGPSGGAGSGGPLPDRFADRLGVVVERLGEGRARARLTVAAEHLNPHGTAHGGAVYALAACALAAAANDEQRSGIARTVLIDHLAPALPGDMLVALTRVIESTPAEDLFEVRVLREGEEQALARLTARITRRPRSG